MNKIVYLALLLLVTTATAQTFTDPIGDTNYHVANQPTTQIDRPAVDITELTIGNEDSETFQITLVMNGPNGLTANPLPLETKQYQVAFEFEGAQYEVHAKRVPCDLTEASLLKIDEFGESNAGCIEKQFEANPPTFKFIVPKEQILNAQGEYPRSGSKITNIQATAKELLIPTGPDNRIIDLGPDTPIPEWRFQTSLLEANEVQFTPLQNTRYSNGIAGTLAYKILTENQGDTIRFIELAAAETPAEWEITLPPSFTLEPGQSKEIAVIITPPDKHLHGALETAAIEAIVEGESAIIELNIQYLSIPQPAGHHDTLYVHTADKDIAWMNTNEPEDEPFSVAPPNSKSEGLELIYNWFFPLEPSLNLGLQFQDNGTGLASFIIDANVVDRSGELRASLYYCPGQGSEVVGSTKHGRCSVEALLLAEGAQDADFSGLGQFIEIPLEIKVPGASIPPSANSNLILDVQFTTEVPHGIQETGLMIQPGSMIQLPLLEYLDDVDESIRDSQLISLSRNTDFESRAKPDSKAWVDFGIESQVESVVIIQFTGHNTGWIEGDFPTEYPVREGSNGYLIEINIPSDAVDGDFVEAFMVATMGEESVASKFLVTVDSNAPSQVRPDTELNVHENTPGPGLAAFVMVIGVAGVLRNKWSLRQ
jgi:hypothetical protein